jgi:hypothetical protein
VPDTVGIPRSAGELQRNREFVPIIFAKQEPSGSLTLRTKQVSSGENLNHGMRRSA